MSKITDAYDACLSILQGLLPNHTRLPNPYKPNENNEQFLRQGFGIALGPATVGQRLLACQLSLSREFRIIITRKFYAIESDGASKAETEKQIFEDQFLILKEFEKNTTINQNVMNTTFISDSGIQYVLGERDHLLLVESSFQVEYFENLNS